MGALDSGKTQLTAILAVLPESARSAVEQAFAGPEAEKALTLLGDSTLARADYSRSMDDLRAKEAQVVEDFNRLNTWFETVKPKVENYDTLEKELTTLRLTPRSPTAPEPKSGLTRDELDKYMLERDHGYAGVVAMTTAMATQHLKDFGEVLDVAALYQLATDKHISLKEAYTATFGEQIKKKADEAEQSRINKLVEERLLEERKKQASLPYPLRNGSPSVLDVLDSQTDKPGNHTLDTAVAEYERLSANRG